MKKTSRKLALKRTTLRALSGPDLQEVAGGTTVIVVVSVPTVLTTTTVTIASVTCFGCAPADTNDCPRR